ncbi:MAG: leucine-rich repeat protein [Clostridia bacterium]|nr:leucine-rich repeat protein [Clostridia bacterium]
MKRRIFTGLISCVMAFVCGACAINPTAQNVSSSKDSVDKGSVSQQLEILKSDVKLTQGQVMSQIKAKYLIEHGGYQDDDPVVAIIGLEEDALIDTYANLTMQKTLAEYAGDSKGHAQLRKISATQEEVLGEMQRKGLIDGIEHTYSTIMNGFSVKTTYGNLEELEKISGVESVILSDTFNRPQSTSTDASAIENLVDIYPTGIFNSSSVPHTGKGTAVAVLDSGFDCSHSVFANRPEGNLMITEQVIAGSLSQMNASKTTQGLDLSDVYYSPKIPFVYDYADKDADVFPYDSNHGTHVAGIIGGKDSEITGVAVNTQLVLMKVFPDLSEGAEQDDILAALEDAVLLGVDAINLSLGSSCGFAREEDGNKINDVYDKINESGISLITAASNSYSSGFGGEQGNTNKVTNPDSGTVGSPATYATSLSVASISGTKSKYLVGNDEQVVFFKESNAITGDENDFFKELGLQEGETRTYEYVTIPGVGLKVNYSTVGDLTGKIALIRRGDNTFEEKAQNAKNAGAAACIIYNNVEGDILMSMGKSDHIPTISISKDDGVKLAEKDNGTLTISYQNQAGPFMSDFSSWGPTPSLGLKPEITAHGGNIRSSVPGGGYDNISGTSMASPNLCGIVILIRQYIKDNYPSLTMKEMSVLANQLLMSTATIIKNEQGNPYSPRKQGAGLASLYNAVNTKAYLTVDGSDRSKLELLDDPQRTGVYEMKFNVVNLSDVSLSYDLSIVGMTESVSTSDKEYVAEKSKVLNGGCGYTVTEGGTINGDTLTVQPNATAKVKVTYTLTDAEKKMIDSQFPYGMYVEGFVKLAAAGEEIDLNIPFLAFYGDWTQAPMFDKTYYEVETEAHNGAIDEEDKLKADYYATTPYGSYYYNYIIPLGTYLYDIDLTKYDAIPATEEHIAVSNTLGAIDGISTVYAGLLRNAKTMEYKITDKLTGEVVHTHVDYNARKAYSNGAQAIPYYDYFQLKSLPMGLVNNHQYEFTMTGLLDYGDGGVTTNLRNSFSFDFYMDEEAPTLKEVTYEKIYDKTLKKDRYYMNMTIYDNQYVQSITPIIFNSSSSYTFLSENPIPVYSEKGQDNKVRFEITEYLEDIGEDALITSALAFSIDDYALNSNIYLCQLPGTKGDFKFTMDGTPEGTDLIILSMYEGELIDVTEYLSTTDKTVDEGKDYLKHLVWSSSNTKVAEVQEGIVKCLKAGKATITVQEQMDLKQAILIINVKPKSDTNESETGKIGEIDKVKIDTIRFSHFETLFAYSRAAQTSEIGSTGSRNFISATGGISFYPGEKIQLFHDLDPWYAEDMYEVSYESTNPTVASVDEKGVVTALKKGSATIVLNVKGSNLKARVRLEVKSEFVIENRMLIAYKGLGGNVEIPDDEGILYIGAYAFCLYTTDQSIELPEDDYDANKIPAMNTSITSVTVPHGVEDIQKYAFYNCTSLRSITIPDTVKFIREFAFYNDQKLETIDLKNVEVIGRNAFYGCSALQSVNLGKVYAIGASAFEGCSTLVTADLTALRNAGATIFKNCTSLAYVAMNEHTKLSYAMFVNSGLKNADIYVKEEIPAFCFAQCKELKSVTIHNDLLSIGLGAFSECTKLTDFEMKGSVDSIGEQAFYGSTALESFTLPNNDVTLGNYAFYECTSLQDLIFQPNTQLIEINGSIFEDTALKNFVVPTESAYYKTAEEGKLLVSKDGKTLIFAAVSATYGDLVLDESYEKIGSGAFSGIPLTSLTLTNKNIEIADYAFANCEELVGVTFPMESGAKIGAHAFNYATKLTTLYNLDKVFAIGDYAFANTGVETATIGDGIVVGEGAFFQSKIKEVTIGASTTFGLGAFQRCSYLTTVHMPEEGGVHFGRGCFAYDIQLAKIDLSRIDETIEDETFYGCTALKAAILTNVKAVGNYAFADCSALTKVEVPVVETIGEGAFARYETYGGGAPIFSEIVLPDTLTTIKDGAFIGCEGLVEIEIPSSVTSLGDYTFAYCLNLMKVVLSENIDRIGTYAFAGCEALITINTENVETFADYAFTSSLSLSKVDLSSAKTIGYGAFASTNVSGMHIAPNLVSVGDYAFQSANLSSLNAMNLASIGEAAFQDNKNMYEFVFSSNLEKVGSVAFLGCSGIKNYTFIKDGDKAKDGEINDYAKLIDGVLYTKMQSGRWQLASVPAGKNVKTLEVAEDTYRVDVYAGSANEYIQTIVLPDTMRAIGNYAFYGYESLKTVEFKSVVAPALESWYDSNAVLAETDPGFELLHNQFDLFGLELYYYNFIDLVGKKEPIQMILPANEDVKGYDSVVFEAYFGKVEDSARSEYVAMEKAMIDFFSYAEKIMGLPVVTLSNEKLVNDAISAYNQIKQNATDYGYTEEEWNASVKAVTDAKAKIGALKLANAGEHVQKLQFLIDALPEKFDLAEISLEKLALVAAEISALKPEDKAVLDLTKYNAILAQYNSYRSQLQAEAESIVSDLSISMASVSECIAAATALSAAAYVDQKRLGL